MSQPYKVAIIGAGIAGLAAYRKLVAEGIKPEEIVVLEGADYVGGRVKQAILPDNPQTPTFIFKNTVDDADKEEALASDPSGAVVDIGGAWFHGITNNPLYEDIVEPNGLKGTHFDPVV